MLLFMCLFEQFVASSTLKPFENGVHTIIVYYATEAAQTQYNHTQ